jgi:tetraacyldisaccharide 4'-kinase
MSGFEQRWRTLISDEHPGIWGTLAQGGLGALALLYGAGVGLYRQAYVRDLLQTYALPCPVVTIGNLTVGGTGKTTTTRWIARRFLAQQRLPAVLSYGFRSGVRRSGSDSPVLVSDLDGVLEPVAVSGDEAQLLARSLPGVPVVIGPHRVRSGRLACERFHPDVCLLDDGFQYWRLKSDLSILMVNADNPLGYSHLLPRGLLREPLRALSRADAVILSHADSHSPAQRAAIRDSLLHYNPALVIAEARHAPLRLRDLHTGGTAGLEALRGRRWLALSSIGHPDGFERSLIQHGAADVAPARFSDHHNYEPDDLRVAAERVRNDGLAGVVTTEKDAVKIPADWLQDTTCYVLEIDLEFLSGEASIAGLLRDRVGGSPEPAEWSSRSA